MPGRPIEFPCTGCGKAVVFYAISAPDTDDIAAGAWADDMMRPWCHDCWADAFGGIPGRPENRRSAG